MRGRGDQFRAARRGHGGPQGDHRPPARCRRRGGPGVPIHGDRVGYRPGGTRPASARCPGCHAPARHRPGAARGADRRRGRRLGQRAKRAARSALGAARPAAGVPHAGRRIVFTHAMAHAAHRTAPAPRARARGSASACDGHGVRGVGVRGTGLRRVAGLQRRRLPAPASHAGRHRRHDGALRCASARPGARKRTILGRQPAEARAGARARAGAAGAPGGTAHPRSGHRRHRIHSRAASRAAGRGLRDPAGLERARRDPEPRRPRAGDERRAHHRRPTARSLHRGRAGPIDGPLPSTGPREGSLTAPPSPPRWADVVVLPLVNLGMALLVAGAVVALIGQSPWDVLSLLVKGAFGSARGFSYTLYYTTTFIFTGLAVAVAAHGGLFNIGAEGQAILGGLGAGLVALWLANHLPAAIVLPLMVVASASFGAGWAAGPPDLQAYRRRPILVTP